MGLLLRSARINTLESNTKPMDIQISWKQKKMCLQVGLSGAVVSLSFDNSKKDNSRFFILKVMCLLNFGFQPKTGHFGRKKNREIFLLYLPPSL
jgi:hypothetical protein